MTDGKIVKMEKDYSSAVDAQIPIANKLVQVRFLPKSQLISEKSDKRSRVFITS